jgi:hypothetical protein
MNLRPLIFLAILFFTISCHDKDSRNKTVLDKVITASYGEVDQYIYRSDGTLLKCNSYVDERLIAHFDYTYDHSRITLIKEYLLDALSATASFIYNTDNNLVEVHISYENENGAEHILKMTWANNQISKIESPEESPENITTTFEYDTRNNATKITLTDTNSGSTTNIFERTFDDHTNPLYNLGDPLDYLDIPSGVPIAPNNYTLEIAKDGNGTIYSNTEIENTYDNEGLLVKRVYKTTYPDADPSEAVDTEYVYKKM